MGNQDQSRLNTLEQEAGFTTRAVERLEATLAELSTQIYDLNGRLQRLEKKLGDFESKLGGEVPNEPPPHSHRPL